MSHLIMDIAAEKQRLRAEMRARRDALTHDEVREAAHVGANALFNPRLMNLFSRFRGFATYMSIGSEFPTDRIHHALFSAGASVCVPYYLPEAKEYAWAAFTPNDPLISGHMRIPEPADPRQADPAMIDVALIPGLLFDVCGGRIGYGGGVYDRLLTKLRAGTLRVALAYDFQVQREPLPQAAHDLTMDYIVTEKQWIDCRLARRLRRERNG
ncbi:MAG: 5-formyltetrahydrofolate cyclo-ligase [Kiritimatiellae bacterium]|jgi:5-formyltetrahydrofolate cyclo-ligase|nr:5-formyltetrahydrofolate cyclo-ligase [Kiritimatiellia bacterium]